MDTIFYNRNYTPICMNLTDEDLFNLAREEFNNIIPIDKTWNYEDEIVEDMEEIPIVYDNKYFESKIIIPTTLTCPTNTNKHLDIKYNCEICKTGDYIINEVDNGIVVCSKCGSVQTNIFDHSLETNNYDNTDVDNRRCSAVTNIFMPQSSLATNIAGRGHNKVKILHNWSSMPYKERSLNNEFKKIHKYCIKGKILKKIEDDAKILYFNINDSKTNEGKIVIIRGVNRKSLIAACIYYACRRNNFTKSKMEIGKLFELDEKYITKGCKLFEKLISNKKILYSSTTSHPDQYIPEYCKLIKLDKENIELAILISRNIIKLNLASVHTPISIACGCILLMSDIKGIEINKKRLIEYYGTSDITITKVYKKIVIYRKILINPKIVDEIIQILETYVKNIKMPIELQNKLEIIKNNIIKYDKKTEEIILPKLLQDKVSGIVSGPNTDLFCNIDLNKYYLTAEYNKQLSKAHDKRMKEIYDNIESYKMRNLL